MKNYTITVNGNVYDVTVEEGRTAGTSIPSPASAPVAAPVILPRAKAVSPAPPSTPAPPVGVFAPAPSVAPAPPVVWATVPTVAPAPPASATSDTVGTIEIRSGAAGKVFMIAAEVGSAVKNGDAVVILEAMKMEIPMTAPQDGTVAAIHVSVGDMVEGGTLLATLR